MSRTASIAAAVGIGLGVTALGTAGYLAYKLRVWPFHPDYMLHPPGTPAPPGPLGAVHSLTSWRTAGLDDRALLGRYLDRGIVQFYGTGTPPAGARRVPLVIRGTPTRMTSTPVAGYRQPYMRDYLAAIRTNLAAAGRSDEDARCAMLLYAEESGFDNAVWNWNIGNIKSGRTLHAPSRDWVLDNLQMDITAPYGSGIYLLVDTVHSLDAYMAYSGAPEYMQREKYLFEGTAWGRQNYAHVLDGYRQGGLDGLIVAQRSLGTGGYSGATALAREALSRYYWRMCTQVMGADFVR